MITKEYLEAISNDFQSTFTLVDQNTMTNLLFENEQEDVKNIIKKHIVNSQVVFERTFQLSKNPNEKDVWIIRVSTCL